MGWFSRPVDEPICAGSPAERLCESCCVRNICEWAKNNLVEKSDGQKSKKIAASYIKNNEVKPN